MFYIKADGQLFDTKSTLGRQTQQHLHCNVNKIQTGLKNKKLHEYFNQSVKLN